MFNHSLCTSTSSNSDYTFILLAFTVGIQLLSWTNRNSKLPRVFFYMNLMVCSFKILLSACTCTKCITFCAGMYSKLAIAHHIYHDPEDDLGGIKLPRPVKQNVTTGRRTKNMFHELEVYNYQLLSQVILY